MLLKDIEVKEGSLELVKRLFEDPKKKVHGVFYDNTFFSQRYLTRSHVLDKKVNIEEDEIKLTIGTRVEVVGLLELENTLDMLVKYEAGDIPAFAQLGKQEELPAVPEPVTPSQYLYTVDIVLRMKQPKVTYQEFTIARNKFTLVTLNHVLDKEGEYTQEVQLLFGKADKFYLFSHFYNKKLKADDVELLLEFLVDKNLTGKAIIAVKQESKSATTGIFPYEKLISAYRNTDGSYIFGASTGYIRIPENKIRDYKLEVVPNATTGSYRIDLISKENTIKIFME